MAARRMPGEAMRPLLLILLSALSVVLAAPRAKADLPSGFVATNIGSGWTEPVGITFDDNGRAYVWERGGRVWIVNGTTKLPVPLIDLHDEVGTWRDYGLLGFALHPNFLSNGYLYLLYAVDHHHLVHAGTPSYDPGADEYFRASISRVTRYTARASDGFTSVDPASRVVLLGESPSTGCPLVHQSHGPGSLVFGQDGTLLASCGDGASYDTEDGGGAVGGSYGNDAEAEGIITNAENVGAFRAQLLSSHAGKILRLDPMTGDGLPSNPYWDAANPRSARSRVWAMGLRNPFRFSRRPNTGSHDPADGNPGALYVGDVGWNMWEDIQVARTPGLNFGWPVFEGMDPHPNYGFFTTPNRNAPNPLNGSGGCAIPFFRFIDLVRQETLGAPSFPNPCNPSVQIPANVPKFQHRRPDVTYPHPVQSALARKWCGINPVSAPIGPSTVPVSGPSPFQGYSSTGGTWYTGTDFPVSWRDSYYHADYAAGWIARLRFDALDQPTSLEYFWPDAGAVVALATSPTQGGLYAVDFGANAVRRIAYAPGGNQPPVARITAAPLYGASPLQVDFSAATSTDPENGPLSYAGSFTGAPPTPGGVTASHTYNAAGPTPFTATLVVTDAGLLTSNAQVTVYVNDTPPQVAITSPANQTMYTLAGPTNVPLQATLSDLEHGAGQLTCTWRQFLHHNTHSHAEPAINTCSANVVVDPIGCDGNTYFFRFELTVADPLGLSTTRDVSLWPDCASLYPVVCGDLDANGSRNASDVLPLRAALANPAGAPLSPTALARCSAIGGEECNLVDATVLRRALAGLAPGPAPVCPAAP
jgi:glucose/arabinose dehydrogenase